MGQTCVLLTATIDPRDCVYVARREPRLRLGDYAQSLRKWLRQPHVTDIVFCENSGWPLDELMAIAQSEPEGVARVRFVSFTATPAGARGKGYGEMEIIEKALAAMGAADSARIIKVSGRYYVANLGVITASLDAGTVDVATGPFLVPYAIASECFAGTAAFMREYLCANRERVDDSRGCFFEKVLAMAVAQAVTRGLRHQVFRDDLHLEGVSGGFDVPWQKTFFASAPILNTDGSIEVRAREHLEAFASLLRGAVALRQQSSWAAGPTDDVILALARRLQRAADGHQASTMALVDVDTLLECARRCSEIASPAQFHTATGLRPDFPVSLTRSFAATHGPHVRRDRAPGVQPA